MYKALRTLLIVLGVTSLSWAFEPSKVVLISFGEADPEFVGNLTHIEARLKACHYPVATIVGKVTGKDLKTSLDALSKEDLLLCGSKPTRNILNIKKACVF